MPTTSLREHLRADEPVFSFEFFPPKTDEGERQLWQAIRELEPPGADFVSVTYGAGGSTRDRTVRVTERIAARDHADAGGPPHLRRADRSSELRQVVGEYADAGVRNVLALRGDPPGGPGAPWEAHPGGCTHADELVALVRELGDFCVGVAAFPEGHPESPTLEHDARVLVAQGRRRRGVRDHPVLLRRRPTTSRSSSGSGPLGCDHADHPGHHAGHRTCARSSGSPSCPAPPLPGELVARLDAVARRPGGGARASASTIATELCASPARRRRAGPALLHAQPLDGDARGLRAPRLCARAPTSERA